MLSVIRDAFDRRHTLRVPSGIKQLLNNRVSRRRRYEFEVLRLNFRYILDLYFLTHGLFLRRFCLNLSVRLTVHAALTLFETTLIVATKLLSPLRLAQSFTQQFRTFLELRNQRVKFCAGQFTILGLNTITVIRVNPLFDFGRQGIVSCLQACDTFTYSTRQIIDLVLSILVRFRSDRLSFIVQNGPELTVLRRLCFGADGNQVSLVYLLFAHAFELLELLCTTSEYCFALLSEFLSAHTFGTSCKFIRNIVFNRLYLFVERNRVQRACDVIGFVVDFRFLHLVNPVPRFLSTSFQNARVLVLFEFLLHLHRGHELAEIIDVAKTSERAIVVPKESAI